MSFRKDPAATLDFGFDWRGVADGETDSWLRENEEITDHVVTVDPGLDKGATSADDGVVIVWLSGGTHMQNYNVTCRITTSQGRTDERTIRVDVRDR